MAGRLARWLGWEPAVSLEKRAIYYATDGRDTLLNSPDGWEISQPWLWWSGRSDTEGVQSGPWGNPLPGSGKGAGWALPAVTRSTNLIAGTLAGLPIRVQSDSTMAPVEPYPRWLADPQMLRADLSVSPVTDAAIPVRYSNVTFFTEWITSALWFGDGFIWVPTRNADGSPKPPLFVLNPFHVKVKDPEGNSPGADQTQWRYFVGETEVPSNQIMHLRGNPPYIHGRGMGVITAHGAEMGLAAATRQWAASQYSAGVPAGFLKVTSPNLTQAKADELKSRWLAAHGTGSRSIAVLNATTEFNPIAISPLDAQLDKAREWSLRDIALAFGVPTWFLGIPGDSGTYSNVESRFIELRTYTLLPWIRRIEAVLDAQFPAGTSTKIVTAGLERGDTSTRYANYKLAIDMGLLTVDEARALEDLPPLPGGQTAAAAAVEAEGLL